MAAVPTSSAIAPVPSSGAVTEKIRMIHIDAFTDKPLTGNPANICVLDHADHASRRTDSTWMQNVAKEANLPVTAFLVPRDAANSYDIRWFAPHMEEKICGHATLAATHALITQGKVAAGSKIHFQSHLTGALYATSSNGIHSLNFPAGAAQRDVTNDYPKELLAALGITAADIVYIGVNERDWLVEVREEKIVHSLVANYDLVTSLAKSLSTRGFLVTARSDGTRHRDRDIHCVSRCIFPDAEDPVTGSAHCFIAPHWFKRLALPSGATLTAYQASSRGGILQLQLIDNDTRVLIAGNAVTIARSEWDL